ncbi:tetratricopeptide repeat protein [Reichenbachiella ulvae]|uniref:Tetratricopeptide repeat protein n=1 Tax=Reichenbachiella ulvae TaxID=2980104 RepID=A0ABT3CVX7_9BACT|nr:tetratricopeptide repeat protein [Reichenbachiella ulvae]MCV9387843.1 tetratricopeptide repeat protein [Reichenbachiella ulvae]
MKLNSVFLLLGFLALLSCTKKELEYESNAPTPTVSLQDADFVGAETCKSCHEAEYENWKGSHHDDAMKVADSTSVKGDFSGVSFASNGVKYHFFMEDGNYMVNTQDGDGQYKDFKIEYTFGTTPLQQYLVPFPNGAYQTLQAAWDDQKNQWFDVQARFEIDTTEWLHWTRGAARWNTMCADCHSTNVHKNYNASTDSYHTTFDEINVACESCHGPGSKHVDYYQNEKKGENPPFDMKTGMESEELVDKCARCHSRRGQITEYFDYTGNFLDHYQPALLTSDIYELDGQIMDEDYVYNSFIQSKMYQNGVSCRDCHDVHSLKLKKQGNALCMQCHEPKYDSPAHHFHESNSPAGQCINCHMTGRTYMGNDFRRDHSFRVPRPDQSVKYGTPNACNGCHADKSAKWASDIIVEKFGPNRPEHFSDELLPGYHGDNQALLALIENDAYPDVARATAVNYLGPAASQQELQKITGFLRDSSALVRREVVQALSNRPDINAMSYVQPLINDSIRLVRISAANYMLRLDPQASTQPSYRDAIEENLQALEMQADFASGQHGLGVYYETIGQPEAAIDAYRKAIKIDNFYNQARMNLALLLYNQGRVEEAVGLYQTVTSQEPEYSYSYYMLGLLYNEQGDLANAMKYLKLATQKEPRNPRAFYNYATMLYQQKQFAEAVKVAQESELYFGMGEEMLYVKMLAQMESGSIREAMKSCEKLMEMAPNNPQYGQIFSQLKTNM